MYKKLTAFFNYSFTIDLTKEQAESGSHQGDCYEDVKNLIKDESISKQFESIEENRIRILWIACGNITEELRSQK